LKKQSQFRNSKLNVTFLDTRDYEKHHAFGGRKNKANQSQSQDAGSDVEWIPAFAEYVFGRGRTIPKAYGFEAATL
jgi:hypothetical protein